MTVSPENEKGIGDASLAGVYRFIAAEKFAVSGMAGIELPTGTRTHEALASDVVIGSGSFDPVIGLVGIYAHQKLMLRANGLYKYNTVNSDNARYGNNFSSSLSVGYSSAANQSLCVPSVKQKTTWSVNAIGLVEQNGITFHNRVRDENSGGVTAFAGGGAFVAIGRVAIPVSLLVPVYERLQGEQHSVAFKARVGASVTF